MTTLVGRVRFLAKGEGGRGSGPPTTARYAATAVLALASDKEKPIDWPWSGGQFSVVLEFEGPERDGWVPATISALVPGAPGSEVLVPGAEVVVLEGSREVARFLIDQHQLDTP